MRGYSVATIYKKFGAKTLPGELLASLQNGTERGTPRWVWIGDDEFKKSRGLRFLRSLQLGDRFLSQPLRMVVLRYRMWRHRQPQLLIHHETPPRIMISTAFPRLYPIETYEDLEYEDLQKCGYI